MRGKPRKRSYALIGEWEDDETGEVRAGTFHVVDIVFAAGKSSWQMNSGEIELGRDNRLTGNDRRVLSIIRGMVYVANHSEATHADIARETGIARQHVSTSCHRLMQCGYIKRTKVEGRTITYDVRADLTYLGRLDHRDVKLARDAGREVRGIVRLVPEKDDAA